MMVGERCFLLEQRIGGANKCFLGNHHKGSYKIIIPILFKISENAQYMNGAYA